MVDVMRTPEKREFTPTFATEWEPFRLMRTLLAREPFREMGAWEERLPAFNPAFELKEVKNGCMLTADLPGVKEKDVEVEMTGNRLTVRGKREAIEEENAKAYYTYERNYGAFTRVFTLPEDVDAEKVKAELKEGVLTVNLPYKPEVHAKKIAVKAEGKN